MENSEFSISNWRQIKMIFISHVKIKILVTKFEKQIKLVSELDPGNSRICRFSQVSGQKLEVLRTFPGNTGSRFCGFPGKLVFPDTIQLF